MKGYVGNIEKAAEKNTTFRTVLYTAKPTRRDEPQGEDPPRGLAQSDGLSGLRDLKPSLQIIRHRATRLPENLRILGEAQQIISLDGHLCGVKLNGLHFQIA